MNYEDESAELKAKFELRCRKCGSLDVVVSVEHGSQGSDETGWMAGLFSIGCNACKDNDFHMSL